MADEEEGEACAHVERLGQLRRTSHRVLDEALADPSSLAANAASFASALKRAKTDARRFPSAGRPRGSVLSGPGWEAAALAPDEAGVRRAAGVAASLTRELRLGGERAKASSSSSAETALLLVAKEERPGVWVGRDRAQAFVVVVRTAGGGLVDAFVLRSDEDAGATFNNRVSRFAQWRKATRVLAGLIGSGRLRAPNDVFTWCSATL